MDQCYLNTTWKHTMSLFITMQLPAIPDGSLDVFLLNFWEYTFDCYLINKGKQGKPCTGSEYLEQIKTPLTEVSHIDFAYNTYMAVYAIAYALQDLRSCLPGHGPFENGSCAFVNNFSSWQVSTRFFLFISCLSWNVLWELHPLLISDLENIN